MTAAAFRASYADWKVIKGRKVVQVIFELPLETADTAYQVLGGMPIAAHEVWCGIARLEKEVVPADNETIRNTDTQPRPVSVSTASAQAGAEKRKFSGMPYSTQAALRCRDPIFRAFLREMCAAKANEPEQAEDFVKEHCGVNRKRDILPDTEAETHWLGLEEWFSAWQTKERAMA